MSTRFKPYCDSKYRMFKKIIMKRFHAVMITSRSLSQPRALQIFNHVPSSEQIDEVVRKHMLNRKPEPVAFIYSEKPQIHIVPLDIPSDMF